MLLISMADAVFDWCDRLIDWCADRKKCSSECKVETNMKIFLTMYLCVTLLDSQRRKLILLS